MIKRMRFLSILLIIVLTAGIAGCGNSPAAGDSSKAARKDAESIQKENQSADKEKTAAAETPPPSEKGKQTEYPLTITTYDGNGAEINMTYEKSPEKVLAVYQGSVEIMLALGLGDKLVAAAGLDNELPEELKTSFSGVKYLDEFVPSKETVTMLAPDMILSWGSLFKAENLGSAAEWTKKGTNTYINTNTRPKQGDKADPRTLENEFQDILNLGKIFDVQDKAEAIVAKMKAAIDQTTAFTAKQEKKPSAIILEFMSDTFTNYGTSSLGGDMLTALGGQLANPEAAALGKEDIIKANPDVIFVVYMPYAGDDPEKVKQSSLARITQEEAFKSLSAVTNKRVIPIMLSEMYASSTRTIDGIYNIAKGLYPDLTFSE